MTILADTVTITLSREDAERYAYWSRSETLSELLRSGGALLSRLCRAELKAQSDGAA